MRIAVVGAGVGGLAAAMRLAAQGHEVTIYERNGEVGGKLAARPMGGMRFDTGPSLLTLPQEFDELFRLAGSTLSAELELVRLDPSMRHHFADGTSFDTRDSFADTEQSIEAFCGDASAWKSFMQRSERIWGIAEHSFFAGPLESPRSLLRRMQSPLDLLHIDPLRSLASRSRSSFVDERMQQWANRYATYSGSSPWKAPATLACIPYIEQAFGCWHVQGGLARLAGALASAANSLGVRIVTNAMVESLTTNATSASGVVVNGERLAADAVVANCDPEHLYGALLPQPRSLKRAQSAGRSSSGFAMLLAVDGTTPGLAHHNVWFSSDQRREFAEIFASPHGEAASPHGVAGEPTIYVCCSSVTDPSAAPNGGENWFVLVNVGAGAHADWDAYGERIIQRLGIGARIRERQSITPQDIEARYLAPGGAIYGASSNGRRSAFLRTANRGPLKGLYVCGGASHPGGGLPLVARSGAIVAAMIKEDM